MSVEAAVSLAAAWRARSPALLAFGGDSAIELLSAVVVLWRFGVHESREQAEKIAARVTGVLLFALAVYVVAVAAMTILKHGEPRPSYVGLAVLTAAAVIMPWLAIQKKKLSAITGSASLKADAVESALCGYLSLIALAGVGSNAIWHIGWADALAALAVTPLILIEGFKAVRGDACGCC